MATITSGRYAPDHSVVVTHWPAPDANGDGEQVWSHDGEFEVHDDNSNPVFHYNPPAGFVAVPTRDEHGGSVHATYVRRKNNGVGPILRAPNGDAINIYPGETLVEYADGSYKKLKTDRERKEFLQAHSLVA